MMRERAVWDADSMRARLREAIAGCGKTYRQIEEEMGISYNGSLIPKILRGDRGACLTVDMAARLALALGRRPEWLAFGVDG